MCDDEIFFDWEDGCSSPRNSAVCRSDELEMIAADTKTKITILQMKEDPCVSRLRHQIQAMGVAHPTGCPSSEDIAAALTMLGIPCILRSSVVDNVIGRDCFKQLRYSFVVVKTPGGPEIFVDPQFQEQFRLARDEPRHEAFVSALPSTFVGTEFTLRETVQLAAQQVMSAMDRLQLDRPPWRNADALLSKWLPRKYVDETLGTLPTMPSSSLRSASWIERLKKPTVVLRRERGHDVPIKASDLKPKCVVQGFSARRPSSGVAPRLGVSPFAEAGPSSQVIEAFRCSGAGPSTCEKAARDLALDGMAGLRLNHSSLPSTTSGTSGKGHVDEALAEVRAEWRVETRRKRNRVM